jgi:hypothetical protein
MNTAFSSVAESHLEYVAPAPESVNDAAPALASILRLILLQNSESPRLQIQQGNRRHAVAPDPTPQHF